MTRGPYAMKATILIIITILGISAFLFWPQDPCLELNACDQYKCLDPKFYCGKTFYKSGIKPTSIADAQKIVMDYVKTKGLTAKVTLSAKTRDPYNWYMISVDLSDGSEYGYEVGPDGNIYEIKHYR